MKPVISSYIYIYIVSTLIGTLFLVSATKANNTLPVPFTMQAPYSQWGVQPWEDACEESVTIMISRFYAGDRSQRLSKKLATNMIQHVVNLEEYLFGFNKDTNADQMVTIINNFLNWEARVVENPSVEAIKQEIDAGRPIIMPFYGKRVNNPHFKNGGPDYHTAVIKGYDDATQDFITNEPGNGWGLDYRYSYDTLMDAMHDFLPDNRTQFGRKVAVFTNPQLSASLQTDGDNDGLSKQEELLYGTILWMKDTDGDGFDDGHEVEQGYSPVTNERTLAHGSLIKLRDDPKVYVINGNTKRHIVNETVFISEGYRWGDVHIVGPTFLNTLADGVDVT